MADDAVIDAIIRFKAENLAAAQEARAAVASLGSEVSGVNLTMGGHANVVNAAKTAERDLTAEANAAARAMGSLGEEGARTFERFTALGSMMASGGGLTAAIGGGVVALGGLLEVMRSAVDNSDRLEASTRGLDQAFATQGLTMQADGAWVDAFIGANSRLISNQFEVRDAIAAATRAGFDQATVQRMTADALDLSVAKHTSLTEAMQVLLMTAEGNTRGLRDLGFSSAEVNTIMGNMHGKIGDVNNVLAALEPKISGAAASESNLTQSGNQLGQSWQNLSAKWGPALADELAKLDDEVSKALDAFSAFEDKLNSIAQNPAARIVGNLLGAAFPLTSDSTIGRLTNFGGSTSSAGGGFGLVPPVPGAVQAGDGSWYVPQSAYAGAAGGGGRGNLSGDVTINVYGSGDPQQAANLTAQQISTMYGH